MTNEDTLRIGNIGEIYPGDILNITGIFADFLKEQETK